MFKSRSKSAMLCIAALTTVAFLNPDGARASSHMDAPLITLDDAANTTDVYAFLSESGGQKYLTTALSVYPFEEPGIGPNKYNFDDNVRYAIHVSLGDDVRQGKPTLTYYFKFNTAFRDKGTILQSYLGTVENVGDSNQNLLQRYRVTRFDRRNNRTRVLGHGVVPPNNQGRVTPYYNQDDDGDQPARDGVAEESALDRYTYQGITRLRRGYRAFAGQRDDAFYADIQSIFDLDFGFQGANKPFDSQGGFNVHTIVLDIPLHELGTDQQVVGVYATTSRRRISVLTNNIGRYRDLNKGRWVQVGRQGNPLLNEALVAIRDKDRYNRTSPKQDRRLFKKYVTNPELAGILVPLLGLPDNLLNNRTDLEAIYIPDLIKVDMSTEPARLAGGGADHPYNPDDSGFSRLGVFGGDTLTSSVQPGLPGFPAGTIPGGWPNGRRFGDDVLDIAVTAVISDLRGAPLIVNGPAGDRVDTNDMVFNKVFPYAATPQNGRNHHHH